MYSIDLWGRTHRPLISTHHITMSHEFGTHEKKMFEGSRSPVMDADKVRSTGRTLARDTVRYITEGKPNPMMQVTPYVRTMRRSVVKIIDKNETKFNTMASTCPTSTLVRHSITGIADTMMASGSFNWGRLVVLYAFCGVFAKHWSTGMDTGERTRIIDATADALCDYVTDHFTRPILDMGGWDAFVQFFALS